MADNNELTLKEKLMHIQHELKAPKNLRNNFGGYNYRNAESILEALKPLLVKYGATVTITDTIEDIGGRIYVKATASFYGADASAPVEVTAYAREAETKKGMDDAQVTGATSSYARKYALNGLFLLDDTQDVDTEAYQKAERAPQSVPQASSNKTTPKTKAKPQSKPQTATQTATQTAPTPQQAPQPDPEVMELRKQLREVMKKYDIDNAVVVTACNLGPNSTADDYRAALNYCESIGGIIGGAES